MKTSCPICGFEDERPDLQIPRRGKNITCPQCEHTYFVERPTDNDFERIEDPAGFEITPKMEMEFEEFQEDEEETEPMQGTDPSVGNVPLKSRVFALFVSIIIGGIGVVILIYDSDFSDIRAITIIVLAIILLLEYVFGKGDALKDLRESKKPKKDKGSSDLNISLEIVKKTSTIILLVGCGVFILIIVMLLLL
jgi:hypothetical protein